MSEPNPKVDFYFTKAEKWQAEIAALRSIALGCDLSEVLKWGCPCYQEDERNIVLIHVFKDYCALLFFKGALMKDDAGILVQQTENVQSSRQIRFTSLSDITGADNLLKAYIREAMEVEKSGRKVVMTRSTNLEYPEEFQIRLDGDAALKAAFEALTPGRQRAYNLFFTSAKQSKTRAARVEKSIPQILAGKGPDD